MRTNLDFTARSALVSIRVQLRSAPALLLSIPISPSRTTPPVTVCHSFSWAPALASPLCALPLELSVSHGKDYLESAAACKHLSDKRPHTAAADGDASGVGDRR